MTGLADPQSNYQEEKVSISPGFSFFVPKEQNEKSTFHRLISNRLERDIEKIKRACPDLNISPEKVFASLERLVEVSAKKKDLSSQESISKLYEMSLWQVAEPGLVEKVLSQKKDLIQWLLAHRELLTENNHSRFKFALSFMRLDPAELDEMRIDGENDYLILNQLDRYYRDTFYKPRKEAALSRKARLTPAAKKRLKQPSRRSFFR